MHTMQIGHVLHQLQPASAFSARWQPVVPVGGRDYDSLPFLAVLVELLECSRSVAHMARSCICPSLCVLAS